MSGILCSAATGFASSTRSSRERGDPGPTTRSSISCIASRVDGLDHGDADLVARWVTCEEIAGRSRLDEAIHAPAGPSALLGRPTVGARPTRRLPMVTAMRRHGLPITPANFSALYHSSKRFLVAEATLDEVER